MRTTFTVDPNGNLVSALRPRGLPHSLQLHTTLEFTKDFPLYGGGVVRAGTRAVVDDIDPEYGTAWLYVPFEDALAAQGHHLVINPFTSEELLECLRVTRRPALSPTVRRRLAVAAAIAAAFFAGAAVHPIPSLRFASSAVAAPCPLGLLSPLDLYCP